MILDIKITILINMSKNNNKNKRFRGGNLSFKILVVGYKFIVL